MAAVLRCRRSRLSGWSKDETSGSSADPRRGVGRPILRRTVRGAASRTQLLPRRPGWPSSRASRNTVSRRLRHPPARGNAAWTSRNSRCRDAKRVRVFEVRDRGARHLRVGRSRRHPHFAPCNRQRHLSRSRIGGHDTKGKSLVWSAIAIFRIDGGKIAEQWVNRDELGMLLSLGVLKPGGH